MSYSRNGDSRRHAYASVLAGLLGVAGLILASSAPTAEAGGPVFAQLDAPAPKFTLTERPAVRRPDPAAPRFTDFDGQVIVTRLLVPVNKSGTLRIDRPFAEALVGNPEIADVLPLTDRTLYVLGKQVGGTRITILDEFRHVVRIVEVEVGYDVEGLRAALRENLPDARISVSSINGNVLLSGAAPDAVALESALAIAQQFAPDAVTNSLILDGGQQVMLEVRFVEASRNAARDLGVNWQASSAVVGNFRFNTGVGHSQNPGSADGSFPSNNAPFGTMIARVLTGGVTADVIIQALEERGLARRLAEPNLVALSGDTASFLAGGEFPFPVARTDNTIAIEFKKFGVGLAFTPTVLGNGLINLKIEPEVSEVDHRNTLVIQGTQIPGIIARRAKTTIELRDGQSFAIAGLLQTQHRKEQRQLPWIGQVPVLGALFRSASFEKNETDLVILVTPRLVRPRGPEQQLVTPFDKSVAGNDVDFFLAGKQERVQTDVGHGNRYRPEPVHGHILTTAGARRPPSAASK